MGSATVSGAIQRPRVGSIPRVGNSRRRVIVDRARHSLRVAKLSDGCTRARQASRNHLAAQARVRYVRSGCGGDTIARNHRQHATLEGPQSRGTKSGGTRPLWSKRRPWKNGRVRPSQVIDWTARFLCSRPIHQGSGGWPDARTTVASMRVTRESGFTSSSRRSHRHCARPMLVRLLLFPESM